jgi:hypothetical protein
VVVGGKRACVHVSHLAERERVCMYTRLAMVGAAVRKRLILHILGPVFKVHGQPL